MRKTIVSLYCEEPPGCLCRTCLYWWSRRCHDKCDKERGCFGGFFNQCHDCEKYIKIDDSKTKVHECLDALIVKYQDGYIDCSLVDNVGCEECYRRFEKKIE